MANKYLINEKSTLIQNKLNSLTKNFMGGVDKATFNTKEKLLLEATKALSLFYKTLNDPIFIPPVFHQNDLPDPNIYNQIWDNISDDLSIIFSELEALESVTIANFNFISIETNRLMSRLKNISSKLGDYILYSTMPTRDVLFFKDSFNDLSRLDINSELLNNEQCHINQDEGIVTLPINNEKNSQITIDYTPIINPNSNGVIGNNQQLGAKYNGDITKILDNNPDTWFEYERVVLVSKDTKEALVLDFTINLGEPKIINYIRINPNNFGTKTAIIIDDISTSFDGNIYLSIKDDIPISNYFTDNEDNIFSLTASTSKYAGQGIYTFTPRKCKYIHLTLKQTEPYLIDTILGEQLRYAIGLRDLDIRGFVYQATGEFISKPFNSINEINKVALIINQTPTKKSNLVDITYYISPDDGQTWNQISPTKDNIIINQEGEVVPEIINYNINDGIFTAAPVKNLRFKTIMNRNDVAFDNNASLMWQSTASVNELYGVPEDSPFEIELTHQPIEPTITIVDPFLGSKGNPQTRFVFGDNKQYYIPIEYNRPYIKNYTLDGSLKVYKTELLPTSEWIHVYVDNEEWTHATAPLSTYSANYSTDINFKLYTLSMVYSNQSTSNGQLLKVWSIVFGNGQNTMAPSDNSKISYYLEPERLFPNNISHIAKLDNVTSNDKQQIRIQKIHPEEITTEVLPKISSIVYLQHQNITDTTNLATQLASIGYTQQVTFINGKDELTATTQWSIDVNNGILYLGTPTSNLVDYSIEYSYQTVTELSLEDWDFANSNVLRDSIKINDSGWETFYQENLDLPYTVGCHCFELAHLGIVQGSVDLIVQDVNGNTLEEDSDPFVKEVPFIDGVTELGTKKQKITQVISRQASDNYLITFSLNQNVTDDTNFNITFSNSNLFQTEVFTTPTTVGEYYIDRDPLSETYKTVILKVSYDGDVPSTLGYSYFGYVYYYIDANPKSDQGLYSINYQTGQVYTQRGLPTQATPLWYLQANYQYTNYRIQYNIARLVTDWKFDNLNNNIQIGSTEIANYVNINRDANYKKYYQINYDYVTKSRESIEELKDYFSPVIKDYALKVITKDKLI